MLMQTQYECAQGLIGETLGVSGLGENQSSALLRVRLTGGIFHQSVFIKPDLIPEKVPRLLWQWITAGWVLSMLVGPGHLLFVMGLLLLVGWNRRLIYNGYCIHTGAQRDHSNGSLGMLTIRCHSLSS